MKLSAGSHSEIEGEGAQSNVPHSGPSSAPEAEETAASNAAASAYPELPIPEDLAQIAAPETPQPVTPKPAEEEAPEPLADGQEEPEEQAANPRQRLSVVGRKRDLINLQSALSPKYIGYANANSPTPLSDSDDIVRTTRRRQNAAFASSSVTGETLARETESPKTIDPDPGAGAVTEGVGLGEGGNKLYMSPIEKLLMKNGASSPNSTGFEADVEDMPIRRSKARKQLKRKMKRLGKAKAMEAEAEPEPEAVGDGEDVEDVAVPATEIAKDAITNECETEAEAESEAETETETDAKTALQDYAIEDKATAEESNQIPEVAVEAVEEPKELVPPMEQKSPPDLSISTFAQPEVNSSIKSPSSVSSDSAKGLSIVTDPGWPTYRVGDLFWGKVFSYCFWPCMVCPDPMLQIVGNMPAHPQRLSTDNAAVPIQVHVRFFADNGRRNWIKPDNLLPFIGIEAFEEHREEVRIKHGPKSAKYRQMNPKRAKVSVWQQAIEEAQMVALLPYPDRLEKFYRIYENTMTQNKQKRKRTNSMMQDTSDVGSSLYDSTDNLHSRQSVPSVAVKRERSESPFSPAFSPVKVQNDMRSKRRKLSGNAEAETGSTASVPSSELIRSPLDANVHKNAEFQQLYKAIKDYVLVHREEEKVQKVVVAVVSNIWHLKQIQIRDMERERASGQLGSTVVDRGRGSIKRLSNRLRTLTVRRSMTPVVAPSPTPAAAEPERSLPEAVTKSRKPVNRPIDEVIEDILALDSKYLFRGLNREPVCKYCLEPGTDLQRCSKSCHYWLHEECLERKQTGVPMLKRGLRKSEEPPSSSHSESASLDSEHITGDGKAQATLTCYECNAGVSEGCVICHQVESPAVAQMEEDTPAPTEDKLLTCSHPVCGKQFHVGCCKYWPQANSGKQSPRCPRHVCHTCVSNDPSGKFQQVGSSKLAKCVRCPATYHQDSHCIPAGTQMLTATHIICPRHNIAKSDAHVNVLWCYICVKGGELVCCETCPIAVHAHCRNIPIKTNESYICEECESGRLPLYGEIVWAKFNNFRWWPAIILPPTEIPSNILKKSHGDSDFVVRFFGTHDHGWISRRRVYLYIEGDTGDGNKNKSQLSRNYTTGVEEASRFLKILQARRQEQAIGRQNGSKLHPPPYVRIKMNKPVPPVRFSQNLEDQSACDCQPEDPHPCGPESGCLNRMLFNECDPAFCRSGPRCENQMFELRKSPRLEVNYMNTRGFGLVCREDIAEGTFVIEYVGEVINHAEFQERLVQKQRNRDENYYFLGVEKDFIIDAGPKGNLARFMNHSCDPNCETQKWTVRGVHRVGIFAIKDIPANTELTFNYLWDDLMNDSKKVCFCGAARCSGEIGGKLKDDVVKSSSKPKQLRRAKGSSIRIHIGAAKKIKKPPKVKHISADDVPEVEVSNEQP
ncbi:hypothetical protein KR018_010414 [Drosophila ironensis]|nr:hypothetical protein KR018_010414 [Drosophila ironensis]